MMEFCVVQGALENLVNDAKVGEWYDQVGALHQTVRGCECRLPELGDLCVLALERGTRCDLLELTLLL
jgi:hypothetical protein